MADITSLNLGKFLQISFSEGVRNQISQDFRDWEMILKNKVGAPNGRRHDFLFQTGFGPAAIQYRGATQAEFPSPQQISVTEHSAVYKEIDATIEIEYNLWNRAQKSPAKYAEPLAMEIQSKTVAAKRRLAADLYADGTGVILQSAGAGAVTGGKTVVTQDTASTARGHIGFIEYGDLLLPKNADGTAAAPTLASGTFAYYRVDSLSRSPIVGGNDTVTLSAIGDDGLVKVVNATGLTAGDVFYRIGQQTIPDLTQPVVDYGTATEVLAGLESLVANDGRTIHNIVMSGASAGSVVSGNGAPLDSTLIQQLMDQTKIRVGQGTYSWKMLCLAPEAHSSLVEARETDRRFNSVEDNKRGIRYWAYQHGNDSLECYTSEFVPKKRAWALPESKSGQKVIEFHGTDFETVRVNDSGSFHLKPSVNGGHERKVATYMEALLCLIVKHPAAVGKLVDFT